MQGCLQMTFFYLKRNCGQLGGAEITRISASNPAVECWTPITGGEEAEEAESSVLLPQLFLIAPIREQGTTLGPIQANGKSLLRFSFLTI